MRGKRAPRAGGTGSPGGRSAEPFWRRKTLAEMTVAEWESLCDGCAKCCLVKLVDEDTEELVYTDVVCRLLDQAACRCTDYANRTRLVPTCVKLTPANIEEIDWMPSTCAYRLIAHGQDLPDWHPLVSGDANSVHAAGMSVRGRVVSEGEVEEVDLEDHVVDWPNP